MVIYRTGGREGEDGRVCYLVGRSADSPADCKYLCDLLNGLYNGKGGGKAGFAQGSGRLLPDWQETAEALPFVTGSYRGNGTSQHIEVGFTPRILLIGQATTTNDINAWGGCSLHVGTTQKVQMSATGFYAFSGNTFPITNKDGFYYSYVAFR